MTENERDRLITELYELGLTTEQQIIVAQLMAATHIVTHSPPLTGSERSQKWRDRQKAQRATSRVTQETEQRSPTPPKNNIIKNNIYIHQREFDAFWAAYPRKVSKGSARKAYAKAILKTSPEAILAAVAKIPTNEPQFIPHPASWLNAERWLDEQVSAPKTNGKSYLSPGKPLQFKEKEEPEWVPPTPEERERRLKTIAAMKAATQAVTR